VLWLLGYPDQAVKRLPEATRLARELGHPFSLAFALGNGIHIQRWRRDPAALLESVEEMVTLSADSGWPFYAAWATGFRGWALAALGQSEEGLGQLRQALDVVSETGAESTRSIFLGLLAQAYYWNGQAAEGLRVLVDAIAVAGKHDEGLEEAERHRFKGELLLHTERGRMNDERQTGGRTTVQPGAEAEACFRNAIEIARHQRAKSWELRAATSLARLWKQQGKTTEAHELLSEIHDWFTEGFDTKDLQEAKALLAELG
jgi:predicted ATPase